MNILQITSDACAPMSANDNNGINRVVTALCTYYVETCHDTCFNAYYRTNPKGLAEVFSDDYLLDIPIHENSFTNFLTNHHIDIVIINVCDPIYVKEIPSLNQIIHTCHIPTIYCIHFMPGYEAYSYADFSMVWYGLTHHDQFLYSLKKWFIHISHPFNIRYIWKKMRNQYLHPLETSNRVVVLSPHYIEQYLQIVDATCPEKFAAIPNALPFRTPNKPSEIAKKEKEVIIVGRLYEANKRLSYALKVWQKVEQNPTLKDWRLTIIGEGSSQNYYKWLVHKYQLKRAVFVGSQDPYSYYRKSSILLSTSANEGWPMVLMECMPMGVVPCVFNSYGATTEIIDHGVNGIIAPENDLKVYYTDLKELMLNDSKRQLMASAAIEKSKSFDMSIIGKRWRDLFLSIQRG